MNKSKDNKILAFSFYVSTFFIGVLSSVFYLFMLLIIFPIIFFWKYSSTKDLDGAPEVLVKANMIIGPLALATCTERLITKGWLFFLFFMAGSSIGLLQVIFMMKRKDKK